MSGGNINLDVSLLVLARSKDFPFLRKWNEAQVAIRIFHNKHVHSPSLLHSLRLGWVFLLWGFTKSVDFFQCLSHRAYFMDTCLFLTHWMDFINGRDWLIVTSMSLMAAEIPEKLWLVNQYLFNWTHKILLIIINLKYN